MSILDADIATGQTPLETDEGIRFSPVRRPEREPRDLRTLYERERARADREQARCEELRLAEVAARSGAGSWKWRFGKYRSKLTTVEGEIKELRCAVKAGAPGLHREVERLCKELSKALSGPSAASRASEHRIGALRAENRELRKAMERTESHKETIRTLNAEVVRLSAELRRQRDDNKTIRLASEKAKGKLKPRLSALHAVGATLSRLPFDQAVQLRTVLRRSRHQKNTIDRQRRENAFSAALWPLPSSASSSRRHRQGPHRSLPRHRRAVEELFAAFPEVESGSAPPPGALLGTSNRSAFSNRPRGTLRAGTATGHPDRR